MLEELQALRKEKAELAQKVHEKAKTIFENGCKKLFIDHPKLVSFSWRQYTPYFNDGDTCVFGVRNDELYVVYDDKEFEHLCDWDFRSNSVYSVEARQTEGLQEAYRDIRLILDALEEDDYLLMFDDHVRVTISTQGIVKMSEYSHD